MRRGMTVEITIWRCKANFAAVALLIFILSLLFSVRQHAQTEKQAISFDLLVKNGTIVTMDGEHRIFGDGVVAVRGDAIAFVGKSSDFVLGHVKGVTTRLTIDARGKLVLPGFVNGHTHVPMTLLRGMRDDVPLDEWLQKYIFPAEAKNVTEDFGHTACRRRANWGWPHHVCRYVFLKMPLPRRRKQQGCARCLAKRCAEADARRGPEFLASTGNCQRM